MASVRARAAKEKKRVGKEGHDPGVGSGSSEPILEGHPQDGDSIGSDGTLVKKPESEEMIEVTINGIRHMLPKSAASAYNTERQESINDLHEAKKVRPIAPAPAPVAPTPEVIKEDEMDETKLFSDPKAFLKKFKKDILTEAKTSLTRDYNAAEKIKKFWSDFYRMHPSLVDKEMIVEGILNRHLHEMPPLEGAEGKTYLADLTKKYILGISGNTSEGIKSVDLSTTLEGGAPVTPKREVEIPKETSRPISLVEAMKERKKSRQLGNVA